MHLGQNVCLEYLWEGSLSAMILSELYRAIMALLFFLFVFFVFFFVMEMHICMTALKKMAFR